jgi:hypothetical protein
MKTKLAALALLACCLLAAPALQAGPLITQVLAAPTNITINIPAGQAIVIVNFAHEAAASEIRAQITFTPSGGSESRVLRAALLDRTNNTDEGASSRQITLAGPGEILVLASPSGTRATLTYKFINNSNWAVPAARVRGGKFRGAGAGCGIEK